jgi:SAM-dependent methyltransferase
MATPLWESIVEHAPLDTKEDVAFFIKPPQDVIPTDHALVPEAKWSPWRRRNYTFYEEALKALPEDALLLDLGAGPQYFQPLTDRLHVVPVDFYPYPGIKVVCDLNEALPFKDGSVDAIMLSNVLEHLTNPSLLLRECYRVLRKGGVVLHTTPFMMRVHQRPYDYFRYTDIAHVHLLREAGFVDTSVVSLSNPFETYCAHTQSFFAAAFNSVYSTNAHTQWRMLRLVKIHRICTRILEWVFTPLYRDSQADLSYTQGYGVIAHK